MEFDQETIVPPGALAFGAQPGVLAIARCDDITTIVANSRLARPTTAQTEAHCGEVLFTIQALCLVGMHGPQPIVVGSRCGQIGEAVQVAP